MSELDPQLQVSVALRGRQEAGVSLESQDGALNGLPPGLGAPEPGGKWRCLWLKRQPTSY